VISHRDALDKPAYDVRTLLDYYPVLDELVSALAAEQQAEQLAQLAEEPA